MTFENYNEKKSIKNIRKNKLKDLPEASDMTLCCWVTDCVAATADWHKWQWWAVAE